MQPCTAAMLSTTCYHLQNGFLNQHLGHSQSQQVAIAFMVDINHCILQANSTLIGHALNNFPLYNLMTVTQLPTTVTTIAQLDKPPLAAQANSHGYPTLAAQTMNNLDSLSKSTLSQGMWFTTMQLDALATQQNKLETQTSHQLLKPSKL